MRDELSQALKARALELGFDLAGVTTAEPLAGSHRLRAWVAAGAHGEMAWMAETAEVRGDPRRFLAGARSVLCVAASYHDAHEEPALRSAHPVVARYARRRDYHRVVRPRLVQLGRFLAERAPGARWRVAVDTAPLLEKELAQRAGLGWIGKNTCLINRRFGSELLLGELVTDVELVPDEPERDRCGACHACLDACPTSAFDGSGRLDARRCIAYATIEHRGELPAAVAPRLAGHLFGCDICQAVCPWNRHAAPVHPRLLPARPHLAQLTLAELRGMDAAAWFAATAGTPLRRLDFDRMQRNLAAAGETLAGGGHLETEKEDPPSRDDVAFVSKRRDRRRDNPLTSAKKSVK